MTSHKQQEVPPVATSPPSPLRVLILDDVPADAESSAHALRRSGLDLTWERIETEDAFAERLDDPPDVILADYHMPGFGAYRAMEMLAERGLELPFIVVSGTIGEERAAAMIRLGANDYVLKDNLVRLRPVVDAALQQARLRAEARQAAANLRESEERYRDLFENANDIIYTFDRDGFLTSLNRAGERAFGAPRNQLVGVVNVMDLFPGRSGEHGRAVHERLLRGEVPTELEQLELVSQDGRVLHVEVTSRPIIMDGEVVGVQEISRDISERVAAQSTIHERERRLKGLFDNALDAILIADDHGRYVDVNPAACALSGYELEHLLTLSVWDLTPEPNPDEGQAAWRSFIEVGSASGEYKLKRCDGSLVDTEFRAVANVVPGLHLSVIRDVTERKRAAEELRATRDRLQAVVEASPLAIYTVDTDGVVQDWNRAAELIYGWTADEAIGRFLVNVPEAKRREHDELRKGVLRGRGFTGRELTRVRKDGTPIEISLSAAPLPDASGRVTGILTIAADVTERKRGEADLRESEERFRQFADNVDRIFWMADVSDGAIEMRYLNRAYEDIWGRPVADGYRFQTWLDALHPEDLQTMLGSVARALGGEGQDNEYRITRPDGAMRWVRDRVFPIMDDTGVVVRIVGISEDVTERKEAQSFKGRLTAVLEQTSDLVSFAACDGRITYCNAGGRRMLGFAEDDDLSGLTLSDMYPEWAAQFMAETALPFALRDGTWSGETTLLTREGMEVPVSQVVIAHRDADANDYFSTIARDVTDRRRFEEELRDSLRQLEASGEQRRQLLARLASAQEQERQRIASDIHDDSVQVMTAVGLRLRTLRNKLTDPGQIATAEQLEETVGSSITRLRRLLFELRPRALDTEGLAAALLAYVEQSMAESGLRFDVRNLLTEEPSRETRVVLYRIAQEALVNVRKHAHASVVEVELSQRDDGYVVCVRDDGVGLESGNGHGSPGHIGITTMQDRAETVGGWLRIGPGPSGGTVVEFWVPASIGVAR